LDLRGQDLIKGKRFDLRRTGLDLGGTGRDLSVLFENIRPPPMLSERIQTALKQDF